jgi:hypothetical protein
MAARSRGHAASHSRGRQAGIRQPWPRRCARRPDRGDLPLPRPRSLDVMADPVFTELVQRIRRHFFTQSTLD